MFNRSIESVCNKRLVVLEASLNQINMSLIRFSFWLNMFGFVCVSDDVTFINNDLLVLNDKCTAERTQESGTCKFIDDCPRIKEATLKSIFPTLCGFEQGKEIVCCPYGEDDIDIREAVH